jgi:hypothetical protein
MEGKICAPDVRRCCMLYPISFALLYASCETGEAGVLFVFRCEEVL